MFRFGQILSASLVVLVSTLPAMAADPPPLHYAFKGVDRVTYRIIETLDDPTGPTVTTAYVSYAPTIGVNEIDLTYRASMVTRPVRVGIDLPPFTPPANFFETGGSNKATIDLFGKVRMHESRQDTFLPAALGQNWQMALPELSPSGQGAWHVSHTMTLFERPHFGGPIAMQHVAPIAATQTFDCSVGEVKGDTVNIGYNTDLATSGPANANFSEHLSGRGTIQFDLKRGLVQSLSAKYRVDANVQGRNHQVPVTLEVQLLSADQVARLKADADARAAELKRFAESRPRRTAPTAKGEQSRAWAESIDLPAGTQKTDFVGDSNGGGPFVKVAADLKPVIGFRLRVGDWAGHKMIGKIEPLYEKPADLHPANETIVLAKDGYAVGGLWANGPDFADALRVIFMKQTPTGVDPKDAYVGPWIGQIVGPERIKLGCNGQSVVGVYGRQGLNTNALGLVMKAAAADSKGNDPTDDPNYQGTVRKDK
jgi:hypothetical protein